MKRKRLVALCVAALGLGIASFGFSAQQAPAKPVDKPALKSVSCPPECGFKVRSHDEQELIDIVKAHAKQKHGMTLTDAQVREMIKTE